MQSNKFTKNAIKAIDYANKVCLRLGYPEMSLEQLFMGILSVKEGVGYKVLVRLGLDPDATIKSIENELKYNLNSKLQEKGESKQFGNIVEVTISKEIRDVFQKAFENAIKSGHSYIGTEHLLLGILDIKDNLFVQELNKLGINLTRTKHELDNFVQYPDFVSNQEKPSQLLNNPSNLFTNEQPKFSGSFLESYGRNLTSEARKGRLDPVIGREKEITRVMQILLRKTKNNPILLGDAGVGKTAIVEGLAQKIASGDVSPILSNYEIWSIDTASIIAGSQLRGDVETKILDMISEIEHKRNILLFIDEIHTILGAGSTSNNPLDIGNILKPALARGTLHCIGATTVDEYRKYFDEDPALQRRFQPVDIEELSEEDTFEVLKNLKKIYESYHGVRITNSAIRAAIKLSKRYITDRYLPDKAIDVVDEACAKNKLQRIQISDEFKQKLEQLRDIVEKKNLALKNQKMEEAASYLDEEKLIIGELTNLERKMKKEWELGKNIVNEKDIKSVIHSWTKIPMNSIEENASLIVKKLARDLNKNIIGQEYATTAVVNAIKRAKAGLSGYDRPLATFLFVGPTGVGKTELAKQLAKSLFGSKDALIQIDMSELMESHSVSKLIGSPPGYVGYDQGGQLTDKIRRKPFSVVLFDEIEKASPEVLNVLLQIMDEGHLTDSKGRKVNFKNTIIILTSNIGAELLRKDSVVGIYLGEVSEGKGDKKEIDKAIADAREKILTELKEYLQPEFLNRIDDVIVFRELSKDDIQKITHLHISNFVKRLKKENNIKLIDADSDEVLNYISEAGFSEEYGAREIKRVIRSTLENAVAEKILDLKWDSDSRKSLSLYVKLDSNNNFLIQDEKLHLKTSNLSKSK